MLRFCSTAAFVLRGVLAVPFCNSKDPHSEDGQDCACDGNGSNSSQVDTVCLQVCLDVCHGHFPNASVITFHAGTYHTGSLVIPSNVTIHLKKDATLLGSMSGSDYPLVAPLPSYGTPRDCCCGDEKNYNCSVPPDVRHRALLTTAEGAQNVAIEGAGTIDGNGWPWWMRFEMYGLDAGRPHLFEPMFAKNIRLEGIGGQLWFKDSAFWTVHPYACDGVTIRNIKITADELRGHNTDGIDPDSTRNVLVENCYVRVGDDAVAIKSGLDFAGREFGVPSENMLFRNNHFVNQFVSIGSEESGGVRNITFLDNVLGESSLASGVGTGTNRAGIYLKSERGRGGYIRDIHYKGLQVFGGREGPVFFSMFYSDARNQTNASATPQFSNIVLEDMVAHSVSGEANWAGQLVGLPEAPILGLHLRNVSIRSVSGGTVDEAWKCSNLDSVTAVDVDPPLPGSCFPSAPSERVV